MAFRRMSRSTTGVLVCMWFLAGAVALLHTVTQFTTMNRAPSTAPALRSQVGMVRSNPGYARSQVRMLAKKNTEDGMEIYAAAEKASATAAAIPWAGIMYAVIGASAAAHSIGTYAKEARTNVIGAFQS